MTLPSTNNQPPWCASTQFFDAHECSTILGTCQGWDRGRLVDGSIDRAHRDCDEVRLNVDSDWWQQKISEAILAATQSLRLPIAGLSEPAMVVRYSRGEHFAWHVDEKGTTKRVVSCTVQLSLPTAYTGGDLAIQEADGSRVMIASRHQGRATFFPSTCLHQVTPVLEGERAALVLWFGA